MLTQIQELTLYLPFHGYIRGNGDRRTANRQSISIGCFYAFGYTFKSPTRPLPPSIPRTIREFAIPNVDACVRAREKSDAVISTYLHESLARTTCLHSFHPRNGN